MKRLLLSLGILLVVSGVSFAQEQRSLQLFTAANGDWNILAPGVMEPDKNALKAPKKKATYSLKRPTAFSPFLIASCRECRNIPTGTTTARARRPSKELKVS